MSYRRPTNLVRENTEPKPNIHEEREERAAQLEEEREQEFFEEVDEENDESSGPMLESERPQ